MPKRVLDIGNCGLDHGNITNMIQANFSAEVDQANAAADALSMLEQYEYDLVLVNRLLDLDGSSGVALIAQVQQRYPKLQLMLITNFEEHQKSAVAAGAVPGFGKSDIDSPQTIQLLAQYLEG